MSWSLTKPEVFVWFGNVTNQAGSPVLSGRLLFKKKFPKMLRRLYRINLSETVIHELPRVVACTLPRVTPVAALELPPVVARGSVIVTTSYTCGSVIVTTRYTGGSVHATTSYTCGSARVTTCGSAW